MNLRKSGTLTIIWLFALATLAFSQQQPTTAAEYITRGIAAQKAGKDEEAIQEYAAALKISPNDFVAQFNSGVSYMVLQRWENAIACLKAAVAIRPQEPLAHLTLGHAYGAAGRTPEAIAAVKEAIRLDPKLVEAHRALGLYYSSTNRHDEAIRALSDALQLRENDAEILFNLAHAYFRAGSFQKAIEFYNRLIAL